MRAAEICGLDVTQANSASYPQWDGKEYRPKCGDALRLGSKGRYGMVHSTCG